MIQNRLRLAAATVSIGLMTACVGAQESADPVGGQLFSRHCASCHGTFGEGDGPVASVMQVSVPNLRTLTARSGGEFPRDAVLRYIDGRDLPAAHGARLMPVWGDTFTSPDDADGSEASDRIAAITNFIERLQN